MGFFEAFKKKTEGITIEELISKKYEQLYFDECKYVWKNYVPENGQAGTLQGELLREIEKLRCEAQDNGNINWDDDYSFFCDFITKSLTEQRIFSKKDKYIIQLIMAYIKECGLYAVKCNNREVSVDSIDINKIAYTGDNLYDIICDQIGLLQKSHPEPIPYKINKNIKR